MMMNQQDFCASGKTDKVQIVCVLADVTYIFERITEELTKRIHVC